MVNGIFSQNKKEHEAVFYTHGHEDHVGLFGYVPEDVPQFMSKGTNDILRLKYGLIKEGITLQAENKKKTSCDADACNRLEERIVQNDYKIKRLMQMNTWERTRPRMRPKPISIGNIKVTPFFNCHSIYDSHMFLIEAEGKRIWHTGDYREHGYMGKSLVPTLRKFATDIDVLITEGTMLNRGDECMHESKVSEKMSYVMRAFEYVFVLASATDIERLASVKNAAETAGKDLYVCSKFMYGTMEYFTEHEAALSKGLFDFAPRFYTDKRLHMLRRKGMVMVTGAGQMERVKVLLQKFPEEKTVLIYSSWDGYYKIPEQVEASPKYKAYRELFRNVVDIHTPGHADRKTIMKVVDIVNPKEVICIHKEADAKL